ncbi:hypothetical protein ACFTWH_07045 [Streptomyces sp. NPDC057011]|uniref:hypothetical protein n=1 Tax=unclassified Streptomyces TaxID=2593676 RepID=UPI00362C98F0
MTSLALLLAAGAVGPTAEAAQGAGERVTAPSGLFDGDGKCRDSQHHGGKDKCKKERPGDPEATVNVGASIFSSLGQSIPHDTPTKIFFSAADYDTDAMFDDAADELVVNTAGRFLLKGKLGWEFGPPAPADGKEYMLGIFVNDALAAVDMQNTNPGDTSSGITQDVATTLALDVGDRISLKAYQNTGNPASSHFFGGSLAPQLQADWIAPPP